jgi:hypothetical protein
LVTRDDAVIEHITAADLNRKDDYEDQVSHDRRPSDPGRSGYE